MPCWDHILSRLAGVQPGQGQKWKAKCPVHEDTRQSLSLWVNDSGHLMAHCHANKGCTFLAIRKALKTIPSDWGNPVEDKPIERKQTAVYTYRNEKNEPLFSVVRYEPKDFRQCMPDGKGGRVWQVTPDRYVLYRLPELLAKPEQPVIIVEGEKDADRLHKMGLLATTSPCGAGKWRESYSAALIGRRVAIIPDNDGPGAIHARHVAGSLMRVGAASIRIVELPNLAEKGDVSSWIESLLAGGKSENEAKASLLAVIKATPEWVCTARATERRAA